MQEIVHRNRRQASEFNDDQDTSEIRDFPEESSDLVPRMPNQHSHQPLSEVWILFVPITSSFD